MKQYNRLIRNNGQYTDPTVAKASKNVLDEQYGYKNLKITKQPRSYEFQVADKRGHVTSVMRFF